MLAVASSLSSLSSRVPAVAVYLMLPPGRARLWWVTALSSFGAAVAAAGAALVLEAGAPAASARGAARAIARAKLRTRGRCMRDSPYREPRVYLAARGLRPQAGRAVPCVRFSKPMRTVIGH